MSHILVTGASGFIAKHIVLQLLEAGHSVRGSLRSPGRAEEVRNAVRPHLSEPARADEALSFTKLDLSQDAGWEEAMSGIDALIHTASPFPLEQPKDAETLIRPAVNGALRALRAAKAAGITRVVFTSSIAAIANTALPVGRDVHTEEDWTDLSDPRATPYVASKTLAERAAWDFVKSDAPEMELTVINPAFVLGPPLDGATGTSMQVIARIVEAKDPALPNVGFPVVDVRDIAAMHVAALDTPESIGRRFIGAESFLWFRDMARAVKAAHPERKIVTRKAPDFVIRILGRFDPSIRTILPNLGRRDDVSARAAEETLGITFRDAREAVREAAAGVLKHQGGA
ncbi:MAG: NAD-dependent epimerase/dehydratase family protein [Pseudomonadota bacterium]